VSTAALPVEVTDDAIREWLDTGDEEWLHAFCSVCQPQVLRPPHIGIALCGVQIECPRHAHVDTWDQVCPASRVRIPRHPCVRGAT
jgi:hypothetical protein